MSEKRMSSQVNALGTVRQDLVPVGMMAPFPVGVNPNGWLLCNGSTYDTNFYTSLFGVLNSNKLPLREDPARVGSLNYFFTSNDPAGYLRANGTLKNRADYPKLYEWAAASGLMITDSAWTTLNATQESVGKFSSGNGTTTFRLPLLNSFIRNTTAPAQVGEWQKGSALAGDGSKAGTGPKNIGNYVDDSVVTFKTQAGFDLPVMSNYTGLAVHSVGSTATDTAALELGVARPNSIQLYPYIQAEDGTSSKWWIKAFHSIQDAAEIYAQRYVDLLDSTHYIGSFHTIYQTTPPAGFKVRDGSLLSTADVLYPKLWYALQNDSRLAPFKKTEAEWQALSSNAVWGGVGGVPFFVIDLAAKTIRLPDTRGMYVEDAGFDGLTVSGTHGDAIRNITGNIGFITYGFASLAQGAFTGHARAGEYSSTFSGSSPLPYDFAMFNASNQVPVATKNQPRAFGSLPCVYVG